MMEKLQLLQKFNMMLPNGKIVARVLPGEILVTDFEDSDVRYRTQTVYNTETNVSS